METSTAFWFLVILGVSNGCVPKDYGHGSVVCVCTKINCDEISPVKRLKSGQYEVYTTSKDGKRFARNTGTFSSYNNSNDTNSPNSTESIIIDPHEKYQTIQGFGGAFTDSAGINILSLSEETQETLLRSYYSEEGLQYSMGRIPIAGTDFSTRAYTYDDVADDYNLQFFSLQIEDYKYKIPLIKKALNLTDNDLKLFATAWTAPSWMKTNGRLSGIGFLNVSMFDIWANYHIKFLDGYLENGISVWGLTTGNEPANGFMQLFQINDMGWIPQLQARWIAENLGPKLRLSPLYSKVKIIAIDDQRVFYPWIPRLLMENQIAASYIDGFGVHYYTDQFVSAEVLGLTHYDFPNKFILATEGCEGSIAQMPVILGSWDRAENYLNSIIDDMNNWVTGWMDWNIALNPQGGPTYVANYVDSPIIVNKTSDEFYKQPLYYVLGQFSKFVRPNSVRLGSLYSGSNLKQVAFRRPDGGTVVAVFNPTDDDVNVTISEKGKKQNIPLNIEKHSVSSVLFW